MPPNRAFGRWAGITPSLTQFVSPLVAGRLYDLDLDQLVAAVGISGSSHFTLGGVVAGHLTNMKNTADPLAPRPEFMPR